MDFFNKLANDTVASINMNFQKSFVSDDVEEDVILLPETLVKAKVRVSYMDVNNEPNANITLAEDVFEIELVDPPVNLTGSGAFSKFSK